ncbi:ThuA domain-containing protein [Horticoccus sp. 23ND18S-11]|uniref:ThuA domain-containing protein n=1 Tax=Horticoccus sp. 23ND18S-11 TaxID=3391832 RepID=UPI0039C9507A
MKKLLVLLSFSLLALTGLAAEKARPIKALLVTGGGFHDYTAQRKTLSEGLAQRLNLDLTIVQEGTTREHRMSIYEKADWAAGYDVIIHNECFGMVTDKEFVERVAAPHKAGTPAVILHASVHSFRNAPTDEWRQVIGQRSMSHENRHDLEVKVLKADNPVMKGAPAMWPSVQDELYKIEKTWPNVIPLAQAYGVDTKQDHVCVWLNTYGKGRSFVTTLGHFDATMKTDVYLDLVARGLLWAIGKLDANGKPMPGYGPGGK